MINYLEKILCVEVIEKILRMKRFLDPGPLNPYSHGADIISTFLKALNATTKNLNLIIERLSEEVVLDECERASTIRQLSEVFESIDKLHLQLQYIHGEWVRSEIYNFIDSTLEFIPADRSPKKVNVILSNLYTFLETDLSTYIEDLLIPININEGSNKEAPTVFLPKIERDNPLNWAILAHECGHIDIQGISNLLDHSNIIPADTDLNTKKILQSWLEEIYCDVFATKILGPSYLASFATFAIMVSGAGGCEYPTRLYPPDIVRIAIVKQVLKKSELKISLKKNEFDCDDLTSLFFKLLEERAKIIDRQHFFSVERRLDLKLEYGDFVDDVCEKVDEVIVLNQELNLKDFARIDKLTERISDGITIGSYPDPKKIEDAERKYGKGKIETDDLDDAKNSVQESRVLLWEIVNAGWLHKVEHIYPRAFELFFQKDKKIPSKELNDWGDIIEGVDKLLLKSIEASEIHRVMEDT